MNEAGDGAEPEAAALAVDDNRRWLPWIGLGVGVWALLPKFSGPPLNTDSTVEFVDHIIPGFVLIPVSLAGVLVSRRARGGPTAGQRRRAGVTLFLLGVAVLLAGLFMLATHIPLVLQAMRGDAPWAGTVYHTTSALAVFGAGLLWSVAHWGDTAEPAGAASAEPG